MIPSRRALPGVLIACVGLAQALGAVSATHGADDLTAQYCRELRTRRLFNLAERYCSERLIRSKLKPVERANLVAELAETLSEHAQYAGASERVDLWGRAHEVVNDLLKADPAHPRRPVLELQDQLTTLQEAAWNRWQAELEPEDASPRETAARLLNTALTNLRGLEQRLLEASKSPPARAAREGELASYQLRALLISVRYWIAWAQVERAEVLLPGDPERAAALLDAERLLGPLCELPEADALVWDSRWLAVRAARLHGDAAAARRRFDSVEKLKPPPSWKDRLLAERVRMELGARDWAAANLLLEERAAQGPLPGELHFLRAQSLGQRWLAAKTGRDKLAPELWNKLEEQVRATEAAASGFWGLRGRMLLDRLRDFERWGPELAVLVRRGQVAYAHSRWDDAVQDYGQAAALAYRQGRAAEAFEWGFTRGAIQLKAERWLDAAKSFEELIDKFPDEPRRADAALSALFARGRHYHEKRTKSRRVDYVASLDRVRELFAGQPAAAEADFLHAQLEEQRQQNTAAIDLYSRVPDNSSRWEAAGVGLARCYERVIERVRELQQPIDEWERLALSGLSRHLPPSSSTERLTLAQAEIAVPLARLLLQQSRPDYALADAWLQRALEALAPSAVISPRSTDAAGLSLIELRAEAWQQRVLSLAGQGRAAEARALLSQLSATNPAELLRILESLTRLSAPDSPAARREISELRLEACLKLEESRAQMSPADRSRLDRCLAAAYGSTGQGRRAVQVLRDLLKETPRDDVLLMSCAEQLEKLGTREGAAEALQHWRTLETLKKPGSAEWLLARTHVCLCLHETGQEAESRKLARVTLVLYPMGGDSATRAQLAKLAEE